MKKIKKQIWRLLKEEDGATMVEYGLMVALVAVVAMVGAYAMGTEVNNLFNTIQGHLANPTGATT